MDRSHGLLDDVPELLSRDDDTDITSSLSFEGIHKGVIVADRWGNEWDDTGELSDIDFRLVDGES